MPRHGAVPKRAVEPDPVFNNRLVAQLTSKMLQGGKKHLAQSIVYSALEIVKQKTGTDPLATFKKAVENTRPILEVKPRRVGGATYQVPVEVNSRRGVTLSLRWIASFARLRKSKPTAEKLAAEIMDAANGTGAAVKKKEDLHKMAEANRAFAHYKW